MVTTDGTPLKSRPRRALGPVGWPVLVFRHGPVDHGALVELALRAGLVRVELSFLPVAALHFARFVTRPTG